MQLALPTTMVQQGPFNYLKSK